MQRQRSGNAYMSMLPHVRGSPGGTSAGSRPAPSTASGVASNMTQVKKRRQRTGREAHTQFFTALPFLSPFLSFFYFAACGMICLLTIATSSHLPPTNQLVQPTETQTGDAPQIYGSIEQHGIKVCSHEMLRPAIELTPPSQATGSAPSLVLAPFSWQGLDQRVP